MTRQPLRSQAHVWNVKCRDPESTEQDRQVQTLQQERIEQSLVMAKNMHTNMSKSICEHTYFRRAGWARL